MNSIFSKIFNWLNIQGLEQKTLVKGASSSFVIKMIGAGLAFAAQIVLARLLGVNDYGAYIYIYSWLTVIVIPVRLGFDNSLVRFIPEYSNADKWDRLKGILAFAYKSVAAASIIVAILGVAGAFYFDETLGGYSTELIIITALALPLLALLQLTTSSLRGFKEVTQALTPNMIIKQLVIIGGTLLLYYFGGFSVTAEGAMAATLAAIGVALVAGLYFLKTPIVESLKGAASTKKYKYWLSITLPMLLITGMNILLKRTDLIMIGSIEGQTAAGVYGAVSKVSDLVVFGLQAVNTIAAPLISELYHTGKADQLQSLVTLATRGAFGLSLLVSVAFGLFGKFILGLFGAEFTVGYPALLILLVAQMGNAFSGSVGFVMTMTGHQNRVALILGISALVNILLNFILVPMWGIEGGALATGVSMILSKIVMIMYVQRKFNINSTIL